MKRQETARRERRKVRGSLKSRRERGKKETKRRLQRRSEIIKAKESLKRSAISRRKAGEKKKEKIRK